MLNKLNLNKMVRRLGVVALLLGLYYILPIHEGFERTPKTASSYTTNTPSTQDTLKSAVGLNPTQRVSRINS